MKYSFFRFLGDLNRIRQIVSAFFQAGFSALLSKMKVGWCASLWCKLRCWFRRRSCPQVNLPHEFRLTLEKLGPTFMKLGQVLSMRPDMIPDPYIQELKKLQDKAPSFPYKTVQSIVEGELKQPLEEVFKRFNKKPVAAASLGQVHKAVLKDGTTVAVKIQRPGVHKILEKDLRIIAWLIRRIEQFIPEAKPFQPQKALQQFEKSLRRELDYRTEGRHADRFRHNFRDDEGVKIPTIYWDYTTEKVLTMEFIDGIRMGDLEEMKKRGVDDDQLLGNCVRACLMPVFSYGFFHADPHPGNVWVLDDNRVVYLDYGMVGTIKKKLRQSMVLYVVFLAKKDIESALYYLLEMAEVKKDSDIDGFSDEATSIMISYLQRGDASTTLSATFYEIIILAGKYHIYFAPELVMLAKSLMTAETMCRETHKNFDFLETAQPILEEVYREEFGIGKLLSEYQKFGRDIVELIGNLPEIMRKQLRP